MSEKAVNVLTLPIYFNFTCKENHYNMETSAQQFYWYSIAVKGHFLSHLRKKSWILEPPSLVIR